MLKINNLSFRVKEKSILHNLNFIVEEGATLAILGPSGCGKTSLLRLIMGFEQPEVGTISWKNKLYSDGKKIMQTPQQRNFGIVFQDSALFPHLNVAGNVGYGLSKLSKFTRKNKVAELLLQLDIPHLAKQLPATLSGGEKQLVALARSLAPSPEVLLLDEPFSNVDRQERLQIITKLQTILNVTKITTLIVTHDVRDALDLCDYVLLQNRGEIVDFGKIETVINNPKSAWAADFLACGLGNKQNFEKSTLVKLKEPA